MRFISFQKWQALVMILFLMSSAKGDDKPDSSAKLMEKKLHFSQGILAGIVKEDFVKVSTNADSLLQLTLKQWIKNDTPEYRAQLKDLWIAVDGIKAAADEKNADGATLAYIQMTLSCVKCHKYLRTPVN